MATTRKADTHWEGSLLDGKGNVTLASSHSGTFDVTWASRATEAADQTSPEELIAAAHATCYSMALSHGLAQRRHPADEASTPTPRSTSSRARASPASGSWSAPRCRA